MPGNDEKGMLASHQFPAPPLRLDCIYSLGDELGLPRPPGIARVLSGFSSGVSILIPTSQQVMDRHLYSEHVGEIVIRGSLCLHLCLSVRASYKNTEGVGTGPWELGKLQL